MPDACHTVSTTCPQCLQTYASSWSCCILCRSSQSSSAWRNFMPRSISRNRYKKKKTVVNIPFTPTRPISNNAAGFFHEFSNPLWYLCTASSHCMVLLLLFPPPSASSCFLPFHSLIYHTACWCPGIRVLSITDASPVSPTILLPLLDWHDQSPNHCGHTLQVTGSQQDVLMKTFYMILIKI
jgi:hypothetical protein